MQIPVILCWRGVNYSHMHTMRYIYKYGLSFCKIDDIDYYSVRGGENTRKSEKNQKNITKNNKSK